MLSNNISKIGLSLFIIFFIVPIAIFIRFPQLHGVVPVEPPVQSLPQPSAPTTWTGPVYYFDRAAILLYHNFNAHETNNALSAADFREQIQTLRAKGYNFISLKQLGDFLDGKQEIPPNAVVITFDDGYQNVYEYAYPVLTEFNLPASIFLIVKNVGAATNQIPKLTWDQIREMQNNGISFYSHSYNSHRLVQRQDGTEGSELNSPRYLPEKRRYESAWEYQNRVYNDLLLSTTTVEQELNTTADFLALPYGYTNDTVKRLAREVGIDFILTVNPGLVDKNSDKQALNRINAGQPGLSGEQLHSLIINFTR